MAKKSSSSRRDSTTSSCRSAKSSEKTTVPVLSARKSPKAKSFNLKKVTKSVAYSEDSKIKFDIAVMLRTLAKAYKMNYDLYLYCMRILDRLDVHIENLLGCIYWKDQIATAIFHFGVRVFGRQHKLKKIRPCCNLRNVNTVMKQILMILMKDIAIGIDINQILRPRKAKKQALRKQVEYKSEADNFIEMNLAHYLDIQNYELEESNQIMERMNEEFQEVLAF